MTKRRCESHARNSFYLPDANLLSHRCLTGLMLVFASALPAYAASPWENAVAVLEAAFTGPIARGLSLVAIVIGGLMFAFGEGDSKRTIAGIIFGVGMAIGAASFLNWLFA